MSGAVENPFSAGAHPMQQVQWDKMAEDVAALAKRYNIPVTSKTIFTQAEVGPNLGKPQKGK